MNFQRGSGRDEPEINLIPMIDVLLVILLFLMVTTTFSHLSQLSINLPQASERAGDSKPQGIEVAIDAAGHLSVNGQVLAATGIANISDALKQAAGQNNSPMIVISADARATHQSVIDVMEAARQAGYARITFATQARS